MEKIKIFYITANGGMWGDNKALLNLLDHLENVEPYIVVGSKGLLINELELRSIPYSYIRNFHCVWPHLASLRDILFFVPRLLRTLFFNWLAYIKISKIIQHLNPDIIHTNIGTVQLGYLLSKKFKLKHVWHLREFQKIDFGMIPFPSFTSFLKKLSYQGNNIITVSNTLYQYFGALSNAQVIYDGVMHAKEKQEIIYNKEKFFLFVGRTTFAKGLDEVIKTFVRFCNFITDYKLIIIGSGSSKIEEKFLNSYLKQIHVKDKIEFLGYRTDANEFMKRASATIVASRNEALGFVTVEAIVNGCLVIGKNKSGTAEILQNGKYGLIYNTSDELLKLMIEVARNPAEKYYPLISSAREWVFENFTIEKNVYALQNLYYKLVNEKKNL
ncbi:MAG: glycosyltransferase family 4 protein [Bacteroidales bacterium]|nr:glycosyltransferase family 4 protein [Bacteroidales bacterium]